MNSLDKCIAVQPLAKLINVTQDSCGYLPLQDAVWSDNLGIVRMVRQAYPNASRFLRLRCADARITLTLSTGPAIDARLVSNHMLRIFLGTYHIRIGHQVEYAVR